MAAATLPQSAAAWDNGLAKTPPMGWNSWNKYSCAISDATVRQTAQAMVSSGMQAAGYTYVNIDDCWATSRAADGTIVPDPVAFPDMKALADYVHGLGLKLGIYTDAGVATCQLRPGSYGYEVQDLATYAAWGIDYVKVDWCNTTDATQLHPPTNLQPHSAYPVFQSAIVQAGRPIVLSACTGPIMNDPATDPQDPPFGGDNPWEWGPQVANLWRSTSDISDNWTSMMTNFHQNAMHAQAAGTGAWNDPDMLEVGNGGMTQTEYVTHFSLWAMMAAPLIAGNDVTAMTPETTALMTNTEVIAVDQDALCVQGNVVTAMGSLSTWRKPLASGAVAVVLLNEGDQSAAQSVTPQQVGLTGPGPFAVRDLWMHASQPSLATSADAYTVSVASHGVVMLTLSAPAATVAPVKPAPAGTAPSTPSAPAPGVPASHPSASWQAGSEDRAGCAAVSNSWLSTLGCLVLLRRRRRRNRFLDVSLQPQTSIAQVSDNANSVN